jgi:hypothetical protein
MGLAENVRKDVEVAASAAAEQRALAAYNRKNANDRVNRAKARASIVPRDLIPLIAGGVAADMLVGIINGEYSARNAKEAIDVAKAALEMVRTEMGEGPIGPAALSDDAREQLKAKARETLDKLRQESIELVDEYMPENVGLRAVPSKEQ